MNYNPLPKAEFMLQTDAVANHHTLVQNEALRKSLSVALAEYTRRITLRAPGELGGCASCFLQLQGAHELVELFYNLAETPTPVERKDETNLATNIRPMAAKKN